MDIELQSQQLTKLFFNFPHVAKLEIFYFNVPSRKLVSEREAKGNFQAQLSVNKEIGFN